MGSLEQITVVFTLALALSLVIERLIEICKAAYDLLDDRLALARFWTRRARRLRDALERRIRPHGWIDPAGAARVLTRFDELLLDRRRGNADGPTGPRASRSAGNRGPGQVPVLSADLVRAVHVRIGARLLGITLGIGAAAATGLDLVARARDPGTGAVPEATPAGIVVTGMLLGLGSAIVHKSIRHIESRRRRRTVRPAARIPDGG